MVEIGELINERYQIISEIGSGGMGIVYCSHDTLLDRDVAIKLLHKSRLDDRVYQRLFYEAKIIAKFNHPNIVVVYDAGEYRDSPFIVMELLEGKSLSEKTSRSIDEIISIGIQICAALDHAHTHGIVHRDLKPENVIILPDGTAKLMDFGIARSGTSRLTVEGEILGTVFYLAPEQALGEHIDHRVDLYSLGVILYEMLTGDLPFVAEDMITVVLQQLNEPVVPLREKNPQIPASLETLVLQLLSKKKENRPASAKDVLQELTRIAEEIGSLSPKLRRIADQKTLAKPTGDEEKSAALPAFLISTVPSVEISPPSFVCRDQELESLGEALERMISGYGGLRFIAGDAGKGKTFLVNEFARRAQETYPDLIVAMGNSDAITGVGDPFLPFRNILSMLTGDVESQWAAGILTRSHATRLWDLLPVAAKVLVERGPNLIGTFVPAQGLINRIEQHQAFDLAVKNGIKTTLAGRIDLSGRGTPQQSRIFEEFTDVVQAISEKHPILLILEDLHWADISSLSLLFHLGKHIRGSKIIILGTYRPQELIQDREKNSPSLLDILSEFKRDYGDISIDLDRSDLSSARKFVDALLDISPNRMSGDFRRRLTTVTGGHPLFTHELIKDLQERGDIFKDEDGFWVEGSNISWDILPAKVEGVIEKRIERLEKPLREILAVASVEGEVFTAEVVARVIQRDEQEVLRMLSRDLWKKYRITIEGPTMRIGSQRLSQYMFQHNLTQVYLYHNLGEARRIYLHDAVGTELERIYGEATEEVALQLSHHFQEAGNYEKAVHYLYQAGVKALKLSAPREAVVHFSNALIQLEANKEIFGPREGVASKQNPRRLLQIKLERRLGEAYFGLGELSESQSHLEYLMRLLGKPIPSSQLPLIGGIFWQALQQVLHLVWPRPLLRRSPEGSPYIVEAMRGYYQLAEIYFLLYKPLQLIYVLLSTTNIAERLEPTSELSWAYAAMGNVAGLIPFHSLANHYIKRARLIAGHLKNDYDQAYVKLVAGLYYSGVGNSSKAYEDLTEALEVYERAGDHRRIGETLAIIATLEEYYGDLARCKELFAKLFSMAVKRENELFKAWALTGLAELDLMSGNAESAVVKLEEAWELLEKTSAGAHIRVSGLLAKAYFLGRRYEKALELADTSYQSITQSLLPIQFSEVSCYAGMVEVYVRLWEVQTEDPGIIDLSNSELHRSARKSYKTLHQFSRVFRIGLPYEQLWKGLYDWLAGNRAKAVNRWEKGLAIAEQLKMPYVQGLLHFEIARHMEHENPERDHQIQAAEEIFSQLRDPYNLARVRDLLNPG